MHAKQVHEIDIASSSQDVWRSLTEPEKISHWFAPEVEVRPGLGGSIFLSWGAGMQGEAPIHLWEPGYKFGWTEQGSIPRIIEFEIQPKSDCQTTLRLVQSGFAEGPNSLDQFEAVDGGWRTFLRILKFGLENHRNQPCKPLSDFRMVNTEREKIVPRLSLALGISPALHQLSTGQNYTSKIGIEGLRLEPDKQGYYLLTASNWNNSLLGIFIEQTGEKCCLTLQAFLFGEASQHSGQLKSAFNRMEI